MRNLMRKNSRPKAKKEPGEPALRLRGVSKRFAGRTALEGVDCELQAGGMLILLGPNGAGKSTLMRIACGRILPDSGEVRLAGRDPAGLKKARSALGFVPQGLALYPHLSVRENLQAFGRMQGIRSAPLKARIESSLSWFGLSERKRDLVGQLSGGMQRQVSILAATLHDPRILLLDEPSLGVDMAGCEVLCKQLLRLREQGTAVLLTTHDLDLAERLDGDLILLRAGRTLAHGKAWSLIEQHFGASREFTITLARAPRSEAAALLDEWGLRRVEDSDVWAAPLRSEPHLIADFVSRLDALDAGVLEFRVARPDLASLCRLLGRADFEEDRR